jgi:hypothetical protein
MSHRKMPPHPRAHGIDKKGEGAAKIRRAWRKWGKLDAQDQAEETLSCDEDEE